MWCHVLPWLRQGFVGLGLGWWEVVWKVGSWHNLFVHVYHSPGACLHPINRLTLTDVVRILSLAQVSWLCVAPSNTLDRKLGCRYKSRKRRESTLRYQLLGSLDKNNLRSRKLKLKGEKKPKSLSWSWREWVFVHKNLHMDMQVELFQNRLTFFLLLSPSLFLYLQPSSFFSCFNGWCSATTGTSSRSKLQ